MEITRNVIIDLLPLYIAGEASEDTQTLVEAYLHNDLQLAKIAEHSASLEGRALEAAPTPEKSDNEMEAYKEARRIINQRTVVWAVILAVIFLAACGLTSLAVFFFMSV